MASEGSRLSWRVVDIVTAAILGVACGLIFLVWNQVGGAGYEAIDAVTPGLGGLVTGIWLIGGTLGGLIIRKPGAAIFVELIAACVSAALGSQWAIATVYSGLCQGLGAEIIFAIFIYKKFNLVVAMLSGVGASAVEWIYEGATGVWAKGAVYSITYLVCLCISGIILSGLVGWLLTRGLAKTGALDRFAAGRELRSRV